MNKTLMSRTFLCVFVLAGFLSGLTFAQAQEIRPALLMQPMTDFTLQAYQGGEITLSQFKGKNVLLIFPRGLAGEDHWCHICNYQYADLAALDQSQQLRETLNLEILFVLPYSPEMVEDWVAKFADQMDDIEGWKNPPEPEKLDDRGKRRMEWAKRAFPESYTFRKGEVPLPFPVLIDAEQKVSNGLGLFTTEWGGSRVEQNIPTVYIVDEQGILKYKYISQNTFDRPGSKYLLKFVSILNKLAETE